MAVKDHPKRGNLHFFILKKVSSYKKFLGIYWQHQCLKNRLVKSVSYKKKPIEPEDAFCSCL